MYLTLPILKHDTAMPHQWPLPNVNNTSRRGRIYYPYTVIRRWHITKQQKCIVSYHAYAFLLATSVECDALLFCTLSVDYIRFLIFVLAY